MTPQKRIQIALLLMLVLVVGMITWKLVPEPEPVYQGKSLSEWLLNYKVPPLSPMTTEVFRAKKVETDTAVRQMGTNAVPTLLRLLRERDSALLLHLLALAQKQHFVRISRIPAGDWNNMAANAFLVLGHSADYVAPELFEISLLPRATAPDELDELTRHDAVSMLAQTRREPELVIPVLIKGLHDPDPSIRANAAVGLAAFGPAARQAVPALIDLLRDQKSGITPQAISALLAIDPEAAARAGVE